MRGSFISRNTIGIILLLSLCYVWIVLVVRNADLLYTIQDFSPCAFTYDLKSLLSHPGGVREWVGDWLTQLCYYPWLGGSVMVLLWALSAWMLIGACRLHHGFQILTFIPIIALLASITQMGYWIFCLKTPSYWFGTTVGLFVIAMAAELFSKLGNIGQSILLAIWILAGTILLGWMATLGALFLLLLVPFRQSLRQWAILLLPALAAWIVALSFYHNHTMCQWSEPLYWYGFPHVIIPEASSQLLEIVFWVMCGSLLLLPVVMRLQRYIKNNTMSVTACTLLLTAALYGANMLHYRNTNFHAELSMMRAMEEARWEDLLNTMKQIERKPTREMVMMKDAALAQLGRLHTEAFRYDIRGGKPVMNVDLPIHMAHSAAPSIYYWLGMPNYAYMWSMENSVEYGLSPHWLRLFYRTAIVNGESELAEKYKQLLRQTLFHADFEVSDEEIAAVKRFVTGNNILSNDEGYIEAFLMQQLCYETYDNIEGLQIALHYSLLMRNANAFGLALDRYCTLLGSNQSLPEYYQQALLVFAMSSSHIDEATLASLPISEEVRSRFDAYRTDATLAARQLASPEAVGDKLYTRYGHTYWWYYDFYNNNKTY